MGACIKSSRVLPFALIKCSVYEYLRVDQLRINLEFFCNKMCDSEEC